MHRGGREEKAVEDARKLLADGKYTAEEISAGQPYTKLKESYILFICKFDPFHDKTKNDYGLARYTFRNICAENNLVNLDDKTLKVVYNASAYKSVEDPKVRALLRFIQTDEPGEDDFSKRLSEFVARVKKKPWRTPEVFLP